ncbi:MAG: thiamine diphosphokinase [bacterium]|nr:thiamine diphosphokinase [bacterium]
MKDCILFLNGSYARRDIEYYRKLCRGRYLVAVDGGYRFFKAAGIFPNLLIGDFDSIRRMPSDLPKSTVVERFPPMKDKTDAELALDHCLARKAKRIDIVQPSYGEPDQMLGNFLLLLVAAGKQRGAYHPEIRIVNRRYEVQLLNDNKVVLSNAAGDLVSVLPLSGKVSLTTTGTSYNVSGVEVIRGRSLGMRNRVTGRRAEIGVAGMALLVRQFGRK